MIERAAVVLDASALLALLHREPGAEQVKEWLPKGSVISAVNWAEVVSKQSEIGIPSQQSLDLLPLLCIQVADFDVHMATAAGALRQSTKPLVLSLGDRACLALGLHLARPVVTADRSWMNLDIDVKVIVIR